MPPEGAITAMTAEQIAERLPELADGPDDDDTTIALARIAAEAIRALNHATMAGRGGLTDPATVYAVLGQLAAATHRLPQLCTQLARWLDAENTAGRLACTDDGLPGAMYHLVARLENATRYAGLLGGALDDAQQTTARLYQPGEGGEDR
jgi:hypothetical protein